MVTDGEKVEDYFMYDYAIFCTLNILLWGSCANHYTPPKWCICEGNYNLLWIISEIFVVYDEIPHVQTRDSEFIVYRCVQKAWV